MTYKYLHIYIPIMAALKSALSVVHPRNLEKRKKNRLLHLLTGDAMSAKNLMTRRTAAKKVDLPHGYEQVQCSRNCSSSHTNFCFTFTIFMIPMGKISRASNDKCVYVFSLWCIRRRPTVRSPWRTLSFRY